MSTGINSQWAAFKATDYISRYTDKIAANVGRLSGNTRFNSSADDPAALAYTQRLRGNVGALEQVSSNIQNSETVLKIGDAAYTSAIEIMQKMREVVAGATDPLMDDTSRTTASNELAVLDARLADLKTGSTFNGQNVFGTKFAFEIGGDATLSLEISAAELPGTSLATTGVTAVSSASDAKTKLATLLTKINTAVGEQAKVGAWIESLGYMGDFVSAKTAAYQEAESNAGDVNVAKEMAAYVRNSVALQAGQLILSQYNQNAYSVLNLLR